MTYKNIILKQMFAFLCLSIFGIQAAFATAKTLPQGVWKFDLKYSSYDIVKGGVNPTGDFTTWSNREADTLTMGDFSSFSSLKLRFDEAVDAGQLDANPINLDTQLVNRWYRNRTHFDIAYGLSNNLTLFANITHEIAEADYTDDYTQTSRSINQILTNQGVGDSFNAAPDKATSNHLRDTYLGIKWSAAKNLSFTYRFSAGPLRTGVDSSEKKYSDDVQELETGLGYDVNQFFVNYDYQTKYVPIQLMAGFILNGGGTHTFLDNTNVRVDYGDMIYLKVATQYAFSPKFISGLSLEHIRAGKDTYQGNPATSSFGPQSPGAAAAGSQGVPATETDVPNSKASATIAHASFKYIHKPFLHFFFLAEKPIQNDKTGQVYDFPGRLEPGLKLSIGTTFFFKAS